MSVDWGFECNVPVSGFHWVHCVPAAQGMPTGAKKGAAAATVSSPRGRRPPLKWQVGPDWYLLAKEPKYSPENIRRYDLSALPDLYRTFSATVPEKKEILEFADCYGSLGRNVAVIRKKDVVDSKEQIYYGDPLGFCRYQIGAMRDLVYLWDLCAQEDYGGLLRHIHWTDYGVFYSSQPNTSCSATSWESYRQITQNIFTRAPRVKGVRAALKDDDLFEQFTPGDVMLPAIVFIQTQINEQLTHLKAEAIPKLVWQRDGALTLVSQPPSLISMLWLQFAAVMCACIALGKTTYPPCQSCGRRIRVASNAARGNRQFCSNACRTRGHRKRQQVARELFASGKSIETIADALGSDAQTIKKWVFEHEKAEPCYADDSPRAVGGRREQGRIRWLDFTRTSESTAPYPTTG